MPSDNPRTPEEIFLDALELPADQRARFVAEACHGDTKLRAEVDSLLRAHTKAGEFLDAPAIEADLTGIAAEPEDPFAGQRIGAYRVRERIGTGGMSTVYLAERADAEFEMTVAVKLIKRGMDTDELLHRFRQERTVLATLQHPNIARLIDGGATEDGRPYLIMEHVRGTTIDCYCRDHSLEVTKRLELFQTVCEAVHHAHQKLVVHRDLKPSNILVSDEGQVKLLDFGIAKVLQSENEQSLALTATGLRILTPRYASPEQVRGETATTSTDVYSLGVVLYEILTGCSPYDVEAKTPQEIERIVCGGEPTRPSTVVTTADGQSNASERRQLARRLSGDLDNIVLMALRKEPERRYASVAQLSEDIERHLDGLPVLARPDTVRYRASKFVRRNKGAVTAAALVVLTLLGSSIVSTTSYFRAESARREAVTQRQTAEEISAFLQEMLAAVDPKATQSSDEVTVREVLDEAAARMEEDLETEPGVRAALHRTVGVTYRNLGEFDAAETHLRRALALRESVSTKPDADLADYRYELHRALGELGRYEEAEAILRSALAVSEQVWPDEPGKTPDYLRHLASLIAEQGDYATADSVGQVAVAQLRQLDPRDPGRLGLALSDLGLIQQRRGHFDAAEASLRESLELIKEARGDTHTQVAQILNNLGYALANAGREPTELIEIFQEALRIHLAVFEETHPRIVETRGNLAAMLQKAGRTDEAIEMFEQLAVEFQELLGPRHQNVGHVWNNMALAYEDKDEPQEAANLYRQAMDIYREQLGPDHPYVGIAQFNLARALRAAGDLDSAERECAGSLLLRREVLRERHPDIARSAHLLGLILVDRGRNGEAVEPLEEAVSIRRAELPPEHAMRASSEVLLGRCLTALARYETAEVHLLTGYAALDSTRGLDHPDTQDAARSLAELYEAWDRPSQAAPFRQMVEESR